jgi:hypothetical protein
MTGFPRWPGLWNPSTALIRPDAASTQLRRTTPGNAADEQILDEDQFRIIVRRDCKRFHAAGSEGVSECRAWPCLTRW